MLQMGAPRASTSHRAFDRLRSLGRDLVDRDVNSMLRACRGARRIRPRCSSCKIMLWTLGGVTPKKAWMSASAGARRLSKA